MIPPLHIVDAGTMPYQPAWDLQLQIHERVSAGEFPSGALMLVEHPPVITVGRRQEASAHLLVPRKLLALRGVEFIESDRGGDITFHGPGQLVAYPILNLNFYNLNLHAYMRLLEETVIRTLATFHIEAVRSNGATGVWVPETTPTTNGACCATGLTKICAIGVKLRRWVTFHGLALNVTTDLSYFQLINPCGLSRPVTSMQQLLADRAPTMPTVKQTLIHQFNELLADQLCSRPAEPTEPLVPRP